MKHARRRVRGSSFVAVLLCLQLASSSIAAARGNAISGAHSPADQRRQFVAQGRELLGQGNLETAEQLLTSGFRQTGDPELLFLLGKVAQTQGLSPLAVDRFRRYLLLGGASVPPDAVQSIERYLAEQSPDFTSITVTAGNGSLFVDDRLVGNLPLPGPMVIAAGSHRFRLERSGSRYESDQLSIPEGRAGELRLTPGSKGTAIAVLTLMPNALLVVRSQTESSGVADGVTRALRDASLNLRLAIVPDERVRRKLGAMPASCLDDRACQLALAEQFQSRHILNVSVLSIPRAESVATSHGPPNDVSCTVRIEPIDVAAGLPTEGGTVTPLVCGASIPADAFTEPLRSLLASASAKPRGLLTIRSVPAGAHVHVNGVLRGTTPFERRTIAGNYQIELDQDGFNQHKQLVTVTVEQPGVVDARLLPLAEKEKPETEPPPAPLRQLAVVAPLAKEHSPKRKARRPLWRLIGGGMAIGGGIVLVGLGISGLVKQGQCVEDALDPALVCDYLYDTVPLGAGLLGGGGGLILGGIGSLVWPANR